MIVIDAGHGGTDPGASGNGIIEKDLNLDISKYMYNRFKELGIPVTMTRTTDETIEPTERVNRILNAYGNKSNVIVLSNHINAGGGDGAEVIYALRNTDRLGNLIAEEFESEGQNVRKVYQRRLPSDTSKDYYFIHRNTGVTQPLIIEYGFLDSTGDDVEQLKNDYEDLTEAVVRAVARYLDVTYVAPEGTDTYVVKAGDSLWSIAKKYDVTVDELKAANNLTANLLSIGQILKIPVTSIEPVEGEYTVYTVKAGDSLYAIAQTYGVTVADLVDYNGLSTTTLSIGQQILIPSEETAAPVESEDYLIYKVQSGDNLYAIAQKYNTTVSDLMGINNLSTSSLSIGQELKIPVEETSEITETTYVVKAGDSLYKIAQTYGTTVNDLIDYNGLTTSLLSIGQVLKIPVEETNKITKTTYVVKAGDSLYKIAQTYGTTVNDLIDYNGLTTSLLSIGQVLKIPGAMTTYIVQSGDSLYAIAKKYNTTVSNLISKNSLSTTVLSIGQELIV
ncbi:MAG: LysM peptidoglycan-binding domain-containing protein [Bacilli bacterium]|nr:LysM peptidoglycan-binding domain-containing protein [Bacilli bacterium]